jgi:hypothetical protein
MKKQSLKYHPEYGLTDEIRLRAIEDARCMEVKLAAKKNRVSVASVYKWRKRAEDAA